MTEKEKKDEKAKQKSVMPIEIKCRMPGYEDCVLYYKRQGWKFKHLRIYETTTLTAPDLAELVGERLEGWRIIQNGTAVTLKPGKEVFDDLDPIVAAWVVGSFRDAYIQSSLPSPN